MAGSLSRHAAGEILESSKAGLSDQYAKSVAAHGSSDCSSGSASSLYVVPHMFVMDDAGIDRLQKRYADREGWIVEITAADVSLYEMIGSVKCLEQRWTRVEDIRDHVSIIR